ncbi:hypothetical protein [Acuticoccus mangrovi]|uniref:Uncharacterized protein n=1 Tax=Acuticoccus mangrovi TaxID=2796142 RepID=A0A934MES5_9HYPH|nr:hypothetical protein [Acuticoccus mangrovi]MBJ3777867.1 hypothetical protein [Acuticoccus mangrovi]
MLARVPWSPPKRETKKTAKPKQRQLNDARRRRMIDNVAEIMKAGFEAGAPSRFAFEASCRHGIRSGLCTEGWTWQEADAAAADIVSRALAMIGATRPSWKEGQPEWTQDGALPIERENCLRCRGPLEGHHYKFCSTVCAAAWHTSRRERDTSDEARAQRAASDAAYRDRAPARACERCGTMYRSRKRDQRYCGSACFYATQREMRRQA